MAAIDSLRAGWFESWVGLGTTLLIQATRGICDGSLLNADAGRADTRARLDEWAGVLPLYESPGEQPYDVAVSA